MEHQKDLFKRNANSYESYSYYENHCWSCHKDVTSLNNVKCTVCGWLICNCGECEPFCGHEYNTIRSISKSIAKEITGKGFLLTNSVIKYYFEIDKIIYEANKALYKMQINEIELGFDIKSTSDFFGKEYMQIEHYIRKATIFLEEIKKIDKRILEKNSEFNKLKSLLKSKGYSTNVDSYALVYFIGKHETEIQKYIFFIDNNLQRLKDINTKLVNIENQIVVINFEFERLKSFHLKKGIIIKTEPLNYLYFLDKTEGYIEDYKSKMNIIISQLKENEKQFNFRDDEILRINTRLEKIKYHYPRINIEIKGLDYFIGKDSTVIINYLEKGKKLKEKYKV